MFHTFQSNTKVKLSCHTRNTNTVTYLLSVHYHIYTSILWNIYALLLSLYLYIYALLSIHLYYTRMYKFNLHSHWQRWCQFPSVRCVQGPYVNVPVQIKAIESKYPLFVVPRLPSPLFVAPRPRPRHGTPGGGGGGAAIVGFLCILRILRSPSRPATALCTLDPVAKDYTREDVARLATS